MNGKFVKWSAALALAATVTAGAGDCTADDLCGRRDHGGDGYGSFGL